MVTALTKPKNPPRANSARHPLTGRRLGASYDAAQTNSGNENHWRAADSLDANAAMSPAVRKKLRERARYETANNCYARGIINTLANDCIGTGPRLQVQTGDDKINTAVEASFLRWARDIDLRGKLGVMRMAVAESGEAFGIMALNDNLPHPVKLDMRLVEADQVTDQTLVYNKQNDPNHVDGIYFDRYGNPESYTILHAHPGSGLFAMPTAASQVPAAQVIHLFRPSRPGQARGVPDLAPALPLFAQLRRYTLATVSAAETAANNAYVLSTTHPSLEAVNTDGQPFEVIDLERNMATVMPEGWTATQMRAEQPTTQYPAFKNEIINEIARCLNIPFNVAALNSSSYNYASGRLDHQVYFKAIRIEQDIFARRVLSRLFEAWLAEALRLPNVLPRLSLAQQVALRDRTTWFWDGTEHVDPAKEAKAQELRLKNKTTTLAREYARDGRDWKQEIAQLAAEQTALESVGLSESSQPAAAVSNPEIEANLPAWWTVNEKRAYNGLKPIPGGDIILGPTSEYPVLDFAAEAS